MKAEIKMLVGIVAIFTISIVSMSLIDESSATSESEFGWAGTETIKVNDEEITYSTVNIHGEWMKYQTRFLIDPTKATTNQFYVPKDLTSMSLRFIDIDENGIVILEDYQTSQITFYNTETAISIPDPKPGSPSTAFSFGATVMHYTSNPSDSFTVYVNMDAVATVDKYDLKEYIRLIENFEGLTYVCNNHSIEEAIEKIKPENDEVFAPELGKDYTWVLIEEKTGMTQNGEKVSIDSAIQKNVGSYYAMAIATEDSEHYKNTTYALPWSINELIVDMSEHEDCVYNGNYQQPAVPEPKTISIEYVEILEDGGLGNEKTSDLTMSFTMKVTKQKNAGVYKGTKGYKITFDDKNIIPDKTSYQWKIDKKLIEKEWITLGGEDFTLGEYPWTGYFTYDGKYHAPIVVSIIDPDLQQEISSVDYTTTVTPEKEPGHDYPLTVTVSNNCKNYKGSADTIWEIRLSPVEFKGEVHVNIIHTTGKLTADMFDDTNTFIYPYPQDFKTYSDEGEKLYYSHPEIHRDCYRIVVLDANGDIVIDEMNPSNEDVTEETCSEWNHIELYGIKEKGFVGCITGHFYVSFDNATQYEIGSTFTDNSITYTVTSLDNKTVSVTGYEEGIASALVIPEFVNGFKVTKIADKAFYGCKAITSLELGDYVTSIGVKAFTNCTKLQSVEFEDSLKTISAYAFYGCTRLADISMDDSVKTIGSYAFYKCTALKTINISGALKTLGGNAFSVSFIDADGKGITQTAKNLAGHTFEGSNKVLKLVA